STSLDISWTRAALSRSITLPCISSRRCSVALKVKRWPHNPRSTPAAATTSREVALIQITMPRSDRHSAHNPRRRNPITALPIWLLPLYRITFFQPIRDTGSVQGNIGVPPAQSHLGTVETAHTLWIPIAIKDDGIVLVGGELVFVLF